MTTAQAVPLNPAQSLKPGHVVVSGRVQYRRKSGDGKTVMTLVTLPAPDEYSHPATVEVVSSSSVGAPGDDVKLLCRLAGVGRTFEAKDDQGDKVQVRTANNRLYVVE